MSAVEIREVIGGPGEENRAVQLSMYPSLTGVSYRVGSFDEEIEPKAFRRSLAQDPDVILTLEHRGLALASTRPVDGAPTLGLNEDETGLRAMATLSPDDPDTQTLKVKARQAPLESSFAFKVGRQTWNSDYTKRTIHEVELHRGDVSIVGRAALSDTKGLVNIRGRGDLELRRRQAELIGKRLIGPGYVFDDSASTTLTVARIQPVGSYVETAKARRAAVMTGEARAGSKYSQADIDKLGKEGKAHKAADGHYHFPIDDHEDVKNAVRALGRAPASERPSIRRFIMKRAAALKATYLIPSTWQPGGSLAPA